jgi:hypothetical protein
VHKPPRNPVTLKGYPVGGISDADVDPPPTEGLRWGVSGAPDDQSPTEPVSRVNLVSGKYPPGAIRWVWPDGGVSEGVSAGVAYTPLNQQ